MSDNPEIVIGTKGGDYVSIQILGRWSANIGVRCDGWSGDIRGTFFKGELLGFAEEISRLYRDLTGTAQLKPLEPNITLTLTGDGKGHVTVEGTARNHFQTDTLLKFQFTIDQTYLKSIGESLTAADSLLADA